MPEGQGNWGLILLGLVVAVGGIALLAGGGGGAEAKPVFAPAATAEAELIIIAGP